GPHMSLTEDNNNTTITIAKGENKEIILHGNPTTGYSWVVDSSEGLSNTVEYVADQHAPGISGSGGKYHIKITGTQTGEGKIVLVYRRPWAPNANDRTFTLKVNVQ
uniref:Amoebiasin-1 n=1 Tax=Entamoeba histolytica TaxID=5759 RepID=UPI00100D9B8F|nr:Chain A, Amoebiasin-1 [Entamoeba histolytica]